MAWWWWVVTVLYVVMFTGVADGVELFVVPPSPAPPTTHFHSSNPNSIRTVLLIHDDVIGQNPVCEFYRRKHTAITCISLQLIHSHRKLELGSIFLVAIFGTH